MNKFFTLFLITFSSSLLWAQSYNGPESVDYDQTTNRYFISNTGNGQILARNASGVLSVFKSGISPSPYGIEMAWGNLYACCGGWVKGWDMSGTQVLNVNLGASFLNGLAHDNNGNLYATDFNGYKIYKINISTGNYSTFVSGLTAKPNGIIYDAANDRLVFVSWGSNASVRSVSMADSSVSVIATTNYTNCDGIAMDGAGNFFVSYWGAQSVVKFDNNFANPTVVASGLSSPADIYYNIYTDTLAIPNSGNNTVTFIGFASPTPLLVCNDVPLSYYPDSLTWGDTDMSGDSMMVCKFKNTSNMGFAYPQIKLNFQTPLPPGMSIISGQQGFNVIASSWNPGEMAYAKLYYNVSQPIPANYTVSYTVSATNLAPANVDTCTFNGTFSINLNPVSVGVENVNNFDFSISPNPVQNTINIKSEKLIAAVRVFSIEGKLLLKANNQTQIHIEFIPAGLYILEVQSGNSIARKKFIKQ